MVRYDVIISQGSQTPGRQFIFIC